MAKPRMTFKYICQKCNKEGTIYEDNCLCGGRFEMEYVEIAPEPFTKY